MFKLLIILIHFYYFIFLLTYLLLLSNTEPVHFIFQEWLKKKNIKNLLIAYNQIQFFNGSLIQEKSKYFH